MWIPIFKAGQHTDSRGTSHDYSPEDLDDIVNNFTADNEANSGYAVPLVKGHPASDAPAYGWAESVARRGKTLWAKLKQVSDSFVEEVREGKFKRISIALTPDKKLRHIGFLGAATPALESLPPAEFTSSPETFQFAAVTDINSFISSPDGSREFELFDFSGLIESNINLTTEISRLNKQIKQHEFQSFIDSSQCRSLSSPAKTLLLEILEQSETEAEFSSDEALSAKIQRFVSIINSTQGLESMMQFPNIAQELDFGDKPINQDRMDWHRRALEYQSSASGVTYEEALEKTAE